MPEIGEGIHALSVFGINADVGNWKVARVVHYMRKHLVGKTLAKVVAQEDANVFGKVGTSADEIMKSLTGKKVVDAKQQGKYFWMEMASPPHLLMHFGMAGWFKFRNEETFYYKPSKQEDSEWPPKYWKFRVETAEEPKCEAAFVDYRRFARVRLIDCAAEEMRKVSPLVENGPDPVIDKDILTEDWLAEKLGSKKIPVKALLLDQANISGIGNWVGDELLYDARIHPEQYSNTLTPAQVKQLHKSIHYVCGFAVEHLSDSSKFPEEWLFKHRWTKGKKDSKTTLPNGLTFKFLTVGGRTSCVVPSVQKKTGPVSKDVEDDGDKEIVKSTAAKKSSKRKKDETEDEDEVETESDPKPSKSRKRGGTKKEESSTDEANAKPPSKSKKGNAKKDAVPKEDEEDDIKSEDPPKPASKAASKTRKSNITTTKSNPQKKNKANSETNGVKKEEVNTNEANTGRRRSNRTSGKGC